ncbi:DUF167 family protein [Thiohalorhabdus methylotrophus]|uniref:UPF0235 protein ACERLL_11930 n=1 Tax=Thiohalorhabdus methylotrophus TaxID=3242694 RepID=A0ABV4TW19_9GAMM
MAEAADFFRWDGDDLILRLRVQPKASGDRVAGRHGGALKVRITAPPVEGAANKHLTQFLAKELGLPKSTVTVERGEKGKDKELRCAGADPAAFQSAREQWEV